MQEEQKEKKAWREVKYKEKFQNAFRGLYVFAKATRHLYLYDIAIVLVVILGFYLKVSLTEWAILALAIGSVFVAEAINTAIEIDIDLTSPDYHPFARDTKDVAAAAVLLAAIAAASVGLIIFLPKILAVIQ